MTRARILRRVAQTLWIAWAVVTWNVVFDYVIVEAGRAYLRVAIPAAGGAGPYVRVEDWMGPAVTRGLWSATLWSTVILLVGVVAIRAAAIIQLKHKS